MIVFFFYSFLFLDSVTGYLTDIYLFIFSDDIPDRNKQQGLKLTRTRYKIPYFEFPAHIGPHTENHTYNENETETEINRR